MTFNSEKEGLVKSVNKLSKETNNRIAGFIKKKSSRRNALTK